jgi:hypothetical protein
MDNEGPVWAAAFFIVILLIIVGHYFPWPTWLREGVINRLFCYTWGPGGVLIGAFFIASLTHRYYFVLAEVFILFAVAGLTTGSCYAFDHYRDTSNRGKRREKTNDK